MSKDRILEYKIIKVTGDDFEQATELLETAVNDFLAVCKDHGQYWEPESRPAGWRFPGEDQVNFVQSMVLRGKR